MPGTTFAPPINRGFEGRNAGMGFMSRLPAATGLLVTGLFASSAGAQSMTAVTQLGWLRIGEYAPIMVAEAKGFFKDEGIDHKRSMAVRARTRFRSSPSARRSSASPPTA
jgi:ABC-type nitrate/sulfonate/bicarbonate transport system substrate-binding protein